MKLATVPLSVPVVCLQFWVCVLPCTGLAAQTKTALALRGLDPVELCAGEEKAGKSDIVEVWGRFHYRFVTAANATKFRGDPERWGIQWGGACSRMGPLSGRGSPDRFVVHEGRIHIFASDGCRDGFLRAPARFAVPAREPSKPTTNAIAKGRSYLEKAVSAHGGVAAIDGRRALRLTGSRKTRGWTQDRETLLTSTAKVRRRSAWTPPKAGQTSETQTSETQTSETQTSETLWVVADGWAFTVEDGEVFDLTSSAEQIDVRRAAAREPIALLWARHRPDFVPAYTGRSKLGGKDVVDVVVRFQDLETTLHLDPESSRILGISWRGRMNDGVTRDYVESFHDWKTVSGVVTPFGRSVFADGKEKKVPSWQGVELLTRSPEDKFRKPNPERGAVSRAVQDYVDALYQAKPELIERSVHPALEKMGTYRSDSASDYAVPSKMTFDQLVTLAGEWNRDGKRGENLRYEIAVMDVADVTASAKLTAQWGIDHMQLIKRDGRWKIIHILWQSHPSRQIAK